MAAVLVLLLLQRLQPGARDRPARGRLGDDPAAHARRRARPRRLRPAPPGREAPVGAGDARSPATPTGRWSTSPAARTPPTSSPASTRPRRGTTSPTASATRRARPWRSSPTTSRRGSRGRACGATRARGSAASTSRARAGPSAHASWTNPDGALATAWEPQRKDAIAAPAVIIARERGRMRIDFDFTRQAGPPAASLQVTVNSSDEAGVPPRTYTFQVAADPPRHAGDRGAARPRQALRHLREHDQRRPARSRRSRRSPSSTRRARWPSCRSPSGSGRLRAAGGADAGPAGALSRSAAGVGGALRRKQHHRGKGVSGGRGARGSARALVPELRRIAPGNR